MAFGGFLRLGIRMQIVLLQQQFELSHSWLWFQVPLGPCAWTIWFQCGF